ncbi:hypothetical protein [Phytohabitans rumicis]|uniref:hypothetical protein n=1 Tax=Phytohabitans rumicis TaxID=1076125 RepID=UPI001567B3CE|nr:hypothetical protein [Phytohabitans rumicis]
MIAVGDGADPGCERPSHRASHRDEMEQEDAARGRVHFDERLFRPHDPVVLDDEIAAHRLGVDHAAAFFIG